jgi:hypothetical protein
MGFSFPGSGVVLGRVTGFSFPEIVSSVWDYIWDPSALVLSNGDPITSLLNTGTAAGGNLTAPGDDPVFAAVALNGLGVMTLTGTEYLSTSGALFSGTGSRTMLAVAKATDSTGRIDAICGQGVGSTPGSWFSLQSREGFVTGAPYFAGYAADVAGSDPVAATWAVYGARWDGTTLSVWRDGAISATGTPTLTGTVDSPFMIGAINVAEGDPLWAFFIGQISEVKVSLTALTDTQMVTESRVLMDKYAINPTVGALAFFQALSDTIIDLAEFTYTDGVSVDEKGWSPGGGYTPQYVRDFAMAVRGRPSKFTGGDILAALAVFSDNAREDGAFPDGVMDDGTTLAGGGGRFFAVDNSYEFIDLCYSHWLKTSTTAAITTYADAITATLTAHTVTNHVCVLDEVNQIGFGFQDGVLSQGSELMTSCYRYRALTQLQEMGFADYTTERAAIIAAIELTFGDVGHPLFKNATTTNTQHSIPANAYCVVVGACSSVRADAIAQFFLDCRPGHSLNATKNFYQSGQIRHLPADEDWTSVDGWPLGEYQNGAYWATFTGWVAQALRRVDTDEADALLGELYTKFLADDPSERPIEASNSDIAYTRGPLYLVSATLPLQAIEGTVTR